MSLFAYPQIGSRPGTSSYVGGVWTSAAPSALSFRGTIQPITGKELESLNVGQDDTGKVKVYSTTKLNVAKKGDNATGDIVYYNGKKWELIDELDYQNKLIQHYKYIAEYRGVV